VFRKYPSLCVLILVVAGIVAADFFRPPGWLLLLFCLVFLILGMAHLSRAVTGRALVLLGFSLFCFAGYHFSIKFYDFGPNHISRFVSEKKYFQIFGRVADWPDLKANRTEIKIEIDSLGRDQKLAVQGSVLLKVSDTTTALQRGDRVEFFATIYPLRERSDPGSFDYARYLQLQGVFGVIYLPTLLDVRVDDSRRFGLIGLVDRIRAALTDSFNRNLSPVSAALASGILIGETRDIPSEIYNRFRDSGTLHLLAVSGSNVALMVLFVILVLRPFSIKRKQRAIILMVCVFVFALLSYGEPSVVRASLMAALVLLATIIERRFDLNQIIATAALIILLFDPAQLFNVGFQLSFTTAWGLIFITPKIAHLFKQTQNKLWFRWLVLPAMVSFIAQICSAPLIAFYFDQVPAISVVANLVIVPLVSIAVVAALLLFVIDLIWPLLGLFFGSLLDSFMASIVFFLELFGEKKSFAIETSDLSAAAVIIIYLFLILAALALFNRRARRVAVAAALIILNVGLTFSMVGAAASEKNRSYLDIFNIPGGAAILIYHSAWAAPDLIMTGIQAKTYPLDERIFESAFGHLGVKSISRLFILSAEYGAMDDILRIAEKMKIRDVYVDRKLIKSFSDIATVNPQTDGSIELKVISGALSQSDSPGVYPSANCVRINNGSSEVIVVDGAAMPNLRPNGKNLRPALIVGHYKELDSAAIEILGPGYFDKIVCSKVNQKANDFVSSGSAEPVYSVESSGPCRLWLPADASDSFSLEPI